MRTEGRASERASESERERERAIRPPIPIRALDGGGKGAAARDGRWICVPGAVCRSRKGGCGEGGSRRRMCVCVGVRACTCARLASEAVRALCQYGRIRVGYQAARLASVAVRALCQYGRIRVR